MNSNYKKSVDLNLYDAIILDFDGVIADSESAQIIAWKWALKKNKLTILESVLLETVGMKDEEIVKLLVEDEKLENERRVVLYDKILKTNEMYKNGEILPVPRVIEFIKQKYYSHVLAIATNSRSNNAKSYCRTFGILKYFKTIVTGDEMIRPKPYPDIYFKTLDKLSLPAQKCIAIEDSITGLKSSKKAGIVSIGLANLLTRSQLQEHSDWVIDSFKELINY